MSDWNTSFCCCCEGDIPPTASLALALALALTPAPLVVFVVAGISFPLKYNRLFSKSRSKTAFISSKSVGCKSPTGAALGGESDDVALDGVAEVRADVVVDPFEFDDRTTLADPASKLKPSPIPSLAKFT